MRLDFVPLGYTSGENTAFSPSWVLLLTLQGPQGLKSQGSLGSSVSSTPGILALISKPLDVLGFEGGWLECLRRSMTKPKGETNS